MYNCSTSIRVCSILIITSNTPEAFKYGNIKKYAYLSHIHIHKILTSKSKYSVGDYFNKLKTTFDYNFDSNQAVNIMDAHKHISQEKILIKKASLLLLVNL